jgi:hypothetical protein
MDQRGGEYSNWKAAPAAKAKYTDGGKTSDHHGTRSKAINLQLSILYALHLLARKLRSRKTPLLYVGATVSIQDCK